MVQIGVFLVPSGGEKIVRIVVWWQRVRGHHPPPAAGDAAQPMRNLLVQHAEAHGRQCHADHYVAGAKPGGGGRLFVQAGHHVAEANGRQAHEAKVDGIDERPLLQADERQRAEQNVHDHHAQAEQNGCQHAQAVHGRTRCGAHRFDVNDLRLFVGRVEIVVQRIRSDVVRLLQSHLLGANLVVLPFALEAALFVGHTLFVVATVAAVGAQATAQRSA